MADRSSCAYRIVYIMADDAISNPVAPSAAMGFLRPLAERLGPVDFLGFESIKRLAGHPASARRWALTTRDALGGNALILGRAPGAAGMILNAYRAMRFLRRAERQAPGGHLVLHGRGMKGAWIGAWARRRLAHARLLFDGRGVDAYEKFAPLAPPPDEERLPDPSPPMRRWLALERQALSAADAMTAVSRNLALYYALAHSAARFPNPLIFPCAADTARFRLRESEREAFRARLGAAGKAVWIYAGSNAPYARLDLAARLLAAIERAAPGMSRYWILSRDWRAIRGTYLAAGVPEAAIHGDAAEHEQVAEWLAAADIGLLTRDRTLVSWVACPVKFAEYLACGLSVALAGPVGDLPEIARQLPASVLPPDGDIAGEEIQTLWRIAARHCEEGAGAIRLANRRMALERFSWEAHLPRLADLYAKMDEAD